MESATLMNLRPLKTFVTGLQATLPVASSSVILPSSGKGLSQHVIHQFEQSTICLSQSTQQSPADANQSTNDNPNFLFPLLPISLTKVQVVFWVNELRRYLFLWKTGRMNSAHAAELHQLLCKIEDKMAHSFLTPQVLGETSLGRMMKPFRHGGLDTRSKEVARRIIQYWRKVCLKA